MEEMMDILILVLCTIAGSIIYRAIRRNIWRG